MGNHNLENIKNVQKQLQESLEKLKDVIVQIEELKPDELHDDIYTKEDFEKDHLLKVDYLEVIQKDLNNISTSFDPETQKGQENLKSTTLRLGRYFEGMVKFLTKNQRKSLHGSISYLCGADFGISFGKEKLRFVTEDALFSVKDIRNNAAHHGKVNFDKSDLQTALAIVKRYRQECFPSKLYFCFEEHVEKVELK